MANSAWPLLRAELSPDIQSVIWIAHLGDFSQHDSGGPETFTAISLKVTEDGYEDDDDSDRRMTADEVNHPVRRASPHPGAGRAGPAGAVDVTELVSGREVLRQARELYAHYRPG
ncbi:hypothetical protein ABZ061_16120 [Streptomyces mutabilis]|uniref:hypothetical protein n=1 Tax=Streptomyces mutabilis TaxID=67332 RepID=UPI0033B0C8E3